MNRIKKKKKPTKGQDTQIRKDLKERLKILAELKSGMSKTPIEKLRLLMGIKE